MGASFQIAGSIRSRSRISQWSILILLGGLGIIAFLQAWDRQSPVLIHCWAGISRSTASAYTALCMLRPKADEEELAFELRAASPSATPNRLIISHTDALLGRQGRMSRAIEKIGRGESAFEGTPFILKP